MRELQSNAKTGYAGECYCGVAGRGGPSACETSRLDIRLTDGDEVVSLARQPPFSPHAKQDPRSNELRGP
jgi:hypothetical protein